MRRKIHPGGGSAEVTYEYNRQLQVTEMTDQRGGAPAPQTAPQGLAAHVAAFLENLDARGYSRASLDAHRWALRQFVAWAEDRDTRDTRDPAVLARDDLEAYQLFLHRHRSPRGGKPLATNTRLARLGCM